MKKLLIALVLTALLLPSAALALPSSAYFDMATRVRKVAEALPYSANDRAFKLLFMGSDLITQGVSVELGMRDDETVYYEAVIVLMKEKR